MLTVDEKKELVKELTEKVGQASGLYLANFEGATVEKVTEFRSNLREKGIRMQVVKNTLLKRVFENCEIKGLDEHLIGPTSLILADGEDPIEPAKVIADFQKRNEDVFSVKVVQMEAQVYPGEDITELAKMPGKRELQAQVIQLAMGPAGNLIALIKGPGSQIAGQIKALIEKLEK